MNYDDRFQQTPPDFEEDEAFAHGGYTNGHDTNALWHRKQGDYWAGRDVPPYPWLMDEWIIRGQCTGLYGVGGVRKTDFMLQLMIAAALGKSFCGIPIEPCKTYGLFCEDTDDDIGRRLHRLTGFYKTTPFHLHDLAYTSLVGVQQTEFLAFDFARPLTTKALDQFQADIKDFKPKLAVLDAVSDFFGGNEIVRREVAQFIRTLDRIGLENDCAILFSAHPSVRGRSSRLLDSGSTGWENKVRARLTLHDPIHDDEDEDEVTNPFKQSDRRILTRAKCNYAEPGIEIPLVIRDGGFFPENIDPSTAPLRGVERDIAARSKFLDLLDDITRQGRWVHDTRSSLDRYAPKVFSQHPDHRDFREKDFARAMRWLLDKKRIRLGEFKHAGRTHPALISTPHQPRDQGE